ncbi:hypothetical protein PV326_001297 [Microctonus aethiopoides]|nr:hypothetical protein PV326_001297 [Microctonus aethiopoides]
MGRSKFPGKPPKTVTRKRIKVLGRPQAVQSDSVTTAENIYYGISAFDETLGNKEKKHRPFHGFSSKEAKLSVSYVKTKQHDADEHSSCNIPNGSVKEDTKISLCNTEKEEDEKESNKELKQTAGTNINDVQTRYENSEQSNKSNKTTKVCMSVKFKRTVRAPVLKSVNNIIDRHQRTRQFRNSTAKRLLQRAKFNVKSSNRNITISSSDKSNSVKKFVLPIRSAHSSRVIKPNKRFIEELEGISGNEGSENEITRSAKKAKTNKFDNILSKNEEKRNKKKLKKIAQSSITKSSGAYISGESQVEDNEYKKHLSSKVENIGEIVYNINVLPKTTGTSMSANFKQISISSKVLPDADAPIVESSKIQSKSGSLDKTFANKNLGVNEENECESEKNNGIMEYKVVNVTNDGDQENSVILAIQESNSQKNYEGDSSLSESGSERSNHSEDEQSEWTGMKLDGGKVILRKARLKLENKNSRGPEGPFSVTNSTNNSGSVNSGMTGTVKCGVCGAVRFYRFVKQARKFGIYSCESCRKFISKIIKRQTCAKSANNTLPVFQCLKGDGMCLVPPVVRSQQWNLMRCVYKTRCPACWLKMCLKCYNITSSVKAELNALLPPLMKDPVVSLGSSLNQNNGDILDQKTSRSNNSWPAEDSIEKNLFKSATNWSDIDVSKKSGHHSNIQGILSKKFYKFDYPISMLLNKKRKKDTRIKVRKKIKNCLLLPSSTPPLSLPLQPPSPSASSLSSSLPLLSSPLSQPPQSTLPATTNQSSQAVRQRVDLKGPRVKHVCRSASVALGQTIATFPSVEEGNENDVTNKIISKPQKGPDDTSVNIDDTIKEKELPKACRENNQNNAENLISQQSHSKRTKSQQNILASNHQVVRPLCKSMTNANHEISIDFWEQYDPAEVGATGFALITSEIFNIPAICFLCGSAGKELLIHCQCCCEPYHAFCLEPSEWNVCVQSDWYCPRCTICQTCHLRTGPKLSCIRCRQSFHHSCLSKSGINARLYSPDRPYICQSCVKCKSCGSEGVNVYVGNLPLCSMCFKLRQRGNYCPLCQRCYNENDFDTKMMECNECSCWVHARCEGLSEEYYQVLSSLPDFIEFSCSQCLPNPQSSWRNAIESELKAGFIAVIKALSKNRKICEALKFNTQKECLCKSIDNVKKFDFTDGKFDRELADESEEIHKKFTNSNEPSNEKADLLNRFDVEADDQLTDAPKRGLRRLKRKFYLKECSVRVKNCVSKNGQGGDAVDQESLGGLSNCSCQYAGQRSILIPSPTLMSVKRKVNGNEYHSLSQFHCDMEQVVNRTGIKHLVELYHESLREVFPWFNPKLTTINSRENDISIQTKDLGKELDTSTVKLDDSILDKWKEEVLTASKATTKNASDLYGDSYTEDTRTCVLCKGLGDGQESIEGRLLYCGRNEWVHSNCALWSNEVFEEIDGSLQNVHSAISRSRMTRCLDCGKKGASVGCCVKNCSNTYHFPCAKSSMLGFNDDKTIFCSLHLSHCTNKNPHNEDEFGVKRLVYVELDRKKKKYAEPNQVKIMIGSLLIECLGTIVPEFSDTHEKLFPVNYNCTRLYWSTVNPMRIVKYYVRSYIQTDTTETAPDVEHNITIDHSENQEKDEWQQLEHLVVKQTLDTLIESVYSREIDENLAEQNNTDLLPPEITDVIFEDLPHDLLDGISMQDIFPKMSYEDFLAMDLKNDGVFGTDLLRDEILSSEVDEVIKSPDNKTLKSDTPISELNVQNDFWVHLETKGCVQELMDDILNSKSPKVSDRELKRSKSELICSSPLMVGTQRHHQRSCSLTWSCKLDGTYGPTMKRRKMPPRAISSTRTVETNEMLLNSHNDKSSMFHELRIPESIMVTVGRTNTSNMISESVKGLQYCIDDPTEINRKNLSLREDNKDHKRLLWHTRQQPRILQVDGSIDPCSASECSSPEYNIEEKIPQIDGTSDKITCDHINRFIFVDKSVSCTFSNRNETAMNTKKNIYLSEDHESSDSFQIPQVDGADDISSDDEISQDIETETLNYIPTIGSGHSPVTCKRCQCTYRTHDSYNRHLINCDIVTTSDSDSETIDNKGALCEPQFSENTIPLSTKLITMSPSEGHTPLSSGYSDIQVASPLEATVPSSHPTLQIEPIAEALITPQLRTHATVETVHQTVLTSNDVIVQTQYTRTTTTLPSPATVLPSENTTVHVTDMPISNDKSISTNLSPSQYENCQIASRLQSAPTITNASLTHNRCIESTQTNPQFVKALKSKSPKISKPKAKLIKPQITRNCMSQQMGSARYQTIQSTAPIQLPLQQQSRSVAPAVILQQIPPQGLMSAYVETLQQQSGQNLQYITTIGGQEGGYKPQFITTNQLVPATYIQTASDNLLALSNGGISVLPSLQITQPQPAVLGTIIQQQPSAIQCGVVSSEQLVLSSTPTLEMFTDSTGSMFVSSQPLYYGLETIVSNTVMSSSQFMAGAVPQVLASSYQTTTQVFQASKLMEPIVDIQTVPNVPTMPTVQGMANVSNIPAVQCVSNIQAIQNVPNASPVHPMQNIRAVQAVPSVPNIPSGYVVVNSPATSDSIKTPRMNISTSSNSLPAPSHDQSNFRGHLPTNQSIVEPIIRPIQQLDPTIQPIALNSDVNSKSILLRSDNQNFPTIPRVIVRPSPVCHTIAQPDYSEWKTEPLYGIEQPINSCTMPYLDSKHVSENTSMIKSSLSSKVSPLSNDCINQRDIVNKLICDVRSNGQSSNGPSGGNSTNSSTLHHGQNKISNFTASPARPMNRVLPMQAVMPKQDIAKPEINIEEPTKPEIKSVHDEFVEEAVKSFNSIDAMDMTFELDKPFAVEKCLLTENEFIVEKNFTDQTMMLREISFGEKKVMSMENTMNEEKFSVDEPIIKQKNSTLENFEDESIQLNPQEIEESKENLKFDLDNDKLQSASLKIVLQKQLQDGTYKITHSMKTKNSPKITSVEILPSKQTSHLASLQLLPIKTFTVKTNKVDDSSCLLDNDVTFSKAKAPPIAVKQPRFATQSNKQPAINSPSIDARKKTEPRLVYEIKSQDGFTHTASSMSEIWDSVFQAVQAARRTHNLPLLAHNPMIEGLGLDNNATVYLIEQLAGANRCTKYKSKFHNFTPMKISESDILSSTINGAARAEPFNGRKVHDMFSWLASRHRQQPQVAAFSEMEMRRATCTNLPMAMRFRMLKETSRESVGVYHSHIHGRGLFCLRDIEAGEMVIEYAGEVIRASLTDKREKYYDSKHIGCYMFKIDDHFVIDATMKGNAARFINHSCEPNCYSKVVDILVWLGQIQTKISNVQALINLNAKT